jgi:archaellum component FlaF (FlaF/FlaG flagellin family)
MNTIIKRLTLAIQKYKECIYNEKDFHLAIESVLSTSNESQFIELHEFLNDVEVELEKIDFLVNDELKRESY